MVVGLEAELPAFAPDHIQKLFLTKTPPIRVVVSPRLSVPSRRPYRKSRFMIIPKPAEPAPDATVSAMPESCNMPEVVVQRASVLFVPVPAPAPGVSSTHESVPEPLFLR